MSQGEKYLVLKKKYRQLLQEQDTKHGDGQRHQSLARASTTAQWEAADATSPARAKATVEWDAPDTMRQQRDEPMSCGEVR